MSWLSQNIATILISAVIFAIVLLISFKLIKNKKQGKSSCGCGCSNCAMNGSCKSETSIDK